VLPDRPAPDATITADQQTISAFKSAFDDYSAAFENTATPLGSAYDNIMAGAGELSGEVQGGATAWLLGWNDVLGAASETTGIMAGNAGTYWLNLESVDTDLSITADIGSVDGDEGEEGEDR
jgi:hypothetical protein